ncbi:unnamed protein product [Closterium sp. NIES-54]
MSTSTSSAVSPPAELYEQSVAILTRLTEKWSNMEEEEAKIQQANEATKRLVGVCTERERAMASLIDRSQQVVSEMRERVGELQRDLEEDAARVGEAKEQKGEQEAEINALVEKVSILPLPTLSPSSSPSKEIVPFSGFTSIRLDVDVKDRFVGTLICVLIVHSLPSTPHCTLLFDTSKEIVLFSGFTSIRLDMDVKGRFISSVLEVLLCEHINIKEIVLFSGFTSNRLDVDVKDRFVGTLICVLIVHSFPLHRTALLSPTNSKEIVLFSGFTNIRLDVDVKDRFVGTLVHPSGNPELARPVDFDASAANTTTVAYQLWNMI